MTRTEKAEKALQWFLKHDVWLIPVSSVLCTLLAATFPQSDTGERFWVALEAMLLGFTLLYLMISYYAHYEYLNEVLKNQRSGLAGGLILLSGFCQPMVSAVVSIDFRSPRFTHRQC